MPAASGTLKTAASVFHLSPAWSGQHKQQVNRQSLRPPRGQNRLKLTRGAALSVADHLYTSLQSNIGVFF